MRFVLVAWHSPDKGHLDSLQREGSAQGFNLFNSMNATAGGMESKGIFVDTYFDGV